MGVKHSHNGFICTQLKRDNLAHEANLAITEGFSRACVWPTLTYSMSKYNWSTPFDVGPKGR